MVQHFNPDIAEHCGIEEAVLFENIYSWCEQNRADNKNFIDGRFWTYNSVKTLATTFKYMTEKKIASALRNLENKGLIITGYYNSNPCDRTKWYAISDFGLSFHSKQDGDKA